MPGNLLVEIQVVSYRLVAPVGDDQDGILGAFRSITNAIGLHQIGTDAPHFVYTIRVSVLQPEILSFDVTKRFSEIAKLDDTLSSLTKFLPFFPPRGAQRILSDEHAKDRMRMLNSYFHVICKMEEVLNCPDFISFFGLSRFTPSSLPIQVGEIRVCDSPTSGLKVSSISVSEDSIMIALSRLDNIASRATSLVNSFLKVDAFSVTEPEGQIQIWSRLPNSLLYERRAVHSFPFRIPVTARPAYFGSSEGRVGFIQLSSAHSEIPSSAHFLAGMVHNGPVSALLEDDDSVWSGGDDGMLQQYSLKEDRILHRISSNAEGAGISRICCGKGLIFVGLTTGVINVFETSSLRLLTLLQGPFSRVVGLELRNGDSILVAAHGGPLVDSVEGYNTVQFWDVSEVQTRGTSKLAHWGPSPSPICGLGFESTTDMVAVVCHNGSVNVFTPSRTEMTHRAKLIFSVGDTINENCFKAFDGYLFFGTTHAVNIWKLPPYDPETASLIDVSTPELCQTVSRPTTSSEVQFSSTAQRHDEEDDLHSWARA